MARPLGESEEATPLGRKWAIPAAILAVVIVVVSLFFGSSYVLLSADSIRGVLSVCMALIGCAMVAEFSMRSHHRVVVGFVGGLCLFLLLGFYVLSFNPKFTIFSYWLGIGTTIVFFLVFALYALREPKPVVESVEGGGKTDSGEQADLRKREVWNAFQKWVQLPIVRFRDQQDMLPLAEKPPDLAFELEECLRRNYSTIWDNLQELRQQYHAWKNENISDRFTKIEDGHTIIDLRYILAYNESVCNKLVALHGQLGKQIGSEILDKHYTRLKC